MKEYKPYIVIFILASILMFFIGCSKEQSFPDPMGPPAVTVPLEDPLISPFTGTPCTPYLNIPTINDWTFKIGDTLVLRNTQGLRTMAYTGSHQTLSDELCNIDTAGSIPAGLADDPEGDGYAGQRRYENYIIAMYHPSTYPDHFITYNVNDGSWVRWDHSAGPGIFRQSE